MEQIKLTIILPVYNSEKFLKNCLDSIIKCPYESMECIIVNDGSVDGSAQICQQYVEKDTRLQLVNTKNHGVSEARNKGLSKARGEYIFFLDADDYLEDGYYNYLFENMQKNYDFCSFSYYTLFDSGSICEESFPIAAHLDNDLNKVYELLLSTPLLNTCWGKLFKRSIIMEHKLEFPVDMKAGEDAIFVIRYLKHVKNCVIVNQPIIYYKQHENSAMRTVNINQKLIDLDFIYQERISFMKELKVDKLESKMKRQFFSVFTNLLLETTKKYNRKERKKYYQLILKDKTSIEVIRSLQFLKLTPFMKKIEYILMQCRLYFIMSGYFEVKSKFR